MQLEQRRFLPVGSSSAQDALWSVPVCATWGDDAGTHGQCTLLTKTSGQFDLKDARGCPAWFFADSNAAAYYAASYDTALTDKLIDKGLARLEPSESAAGLRNVQPMFSSGVGDPEQELTFVSGFSRSSDPGLVRQAAETVRGLAKYIVNNQSQNYARLIRSFYDMRARELGWKLQAGESQEIRLLRLKIVPLAATYGEDPELSQQASVLAREWLKDHQSLDPDMVEPVLSAAAFNGDRTFFDLLVSEIRKDKIQRERSWMIGAFQSFRDPAITRAGLDLILAGDIDPRELEYIIFGASKETREIVWKFVEENFDQLNSKLPGARGIPFGAVLPFTATGFCDAENQAQVESFFQPRIGALPGGARNLANTIEQIRLCSAWSAVSTPAIVSFLDKQ